jgi:hypothetical protein
MTKKNRRSENDPEQQRMKAESTEASLSKATRSEPIDIAQRSLMQRQSKHLHQKDGKKTPGE